MQQKSENETLKDQKAYLGVNQTISEGAEILQQILGIIVTRRDVTRTRRTNSG
jgi:hypothetical protein